MALVSTPGSDVKNLITSKRPLQAANCIAKLLSILILSPGDGVKHLITSKSPLLAVIQNVSSMLSMIFHIYLTEYEKQIIFSFNLILIFFAICKR